MLRQAAQALLAFSCSTRVLLVVSDGEPSGPGNHGEEALHRTVRWIRGSTDLHLLGIGLGPDTRHVTKYYPEAVANVPLADFSEVVAREVEQLVLGPDARG